MSRGARPWSESGASFIAFIVGVERGAIRSGEAVANLAIVSTGEFAESSERSVAVPVGRGRVRRSAGM